MVELLQSITTDKFVLAQNITWILVCLSVITFFSHRLICYDVPENAKRIIYGVIIVAGSSAIHRTYWAIWRWMRENDHPEVAQWFVDWGWMTAFAVAGIIFGYMYHLYPFLKDFFGKMWWQKTAAILIGSFVGLLFIL